MTNSSDNKNDNRGFFRSLYDKTKEASKSVWQGISGLWSEENKDLSISIDTQNLLKILMRADMSHATAKQILRYADRGDYSEMELKQLMAKNISKILLNSYQPLIFNEIHRPTIIFMVGSNGTGKTLTAAKLAYKLQNEGKRVLLCAADSFRAAAVTQLQKLATKINCPCFIKDSKSPTSIIYEAVIMAQKEMFDVVIVDTAGRLHSNQNLIMELQKCITTIHKIDNRLQIYSIIVLDANTGQNNIIQVRGFFIPNVKQGIIMTKLDGTARGGTLVEIAREFNLPIYALGYGEKIEDLYDLDSDLLAKALCGLPMNKK